MRRHSSDCMIGFLVLIAAAPAGAGGLLPFVDETPTRLVADPLLGALDLQEKDYAWGDVDGDGDDDLVVARKQPYSTAGRRINVLLLNEAGVLTDRSAEYASAADDGGQGFLDATNDRDVQLVDLTGDGRLDIVTAVACYLNNCPGVSKTLTHPRVYVNLGPDGEGNWLGFRYEEDRIPEFSQAPNFTAVAAGDVTGDGYADLYFTDSFSTLEDRLLINAGLANPGHFGDESLDRLTLPMMFSNYATNAVIADMNGDLYNDIVKSESGNVEIFYNAGGGYFEVLDPVGDGATYYVDVGELNGDGMLDLVAVDDGSDRYHLHQGNDQQGLATFLPFVFPPATMGFGSNALHADLDNDGWNDVIVADVDVDVPGCTRVTDILRNNADPPDVTFATPATDIPELMLQGVFDAAAFDINGDGWKDLVLGRCNGTSVWISAPVLCPADLDDSGSVDIIDLLALLAAWGTDPGGPPDFDGDGIVGVIDLLTLLAAWGDCL